VIDQQLPISIPKERTASLRAPSGAPPRILVADSFASEGLDILATGAQVDVKKGLPESELIATLRAGGYRAIVVRSETRVTEAVLAASPALQVVARAGVGVDTIDVEAATRHGVLVINMPTGNTITTAEHTLAMLFACTRSIPQANASLRAGTWIRAPWIGVELMGKTLGIVGLGRIGSEVARRAQAIGMKVIAYDPYVSPEVGQRLHVPLYGSLHTLLSQCQFLTVHTPLTTETRGMIDDAALAALPAGSRVINCARGGIIEEDALLAALDSGHLAAAALDVFVDEPVRNAAHPLVAHPHLVCTPHLGSATAEAEVKVAIGLARDLLVALDGGGVGAAVNGPLLTAESAKVIAPFVTLARRLGELAVQWDTGALRRLDVTVSGELAGESCSPLTTAALAAVLDQVTDVRVNLVNARLLAEERGLQIEETSIAEGDTEYRNTLTVHLQRNDQRFVTMKGTVTHGEPHIVAINDYGVDLALTPGTWLCTYHDDRPGFIGELGTLLGRANVNIGFMQLGRDRPRGMALMIVGVDDSVPPAVLQKIEDLPAVHSARVVTVR